MLYMCDYVKHNTFPPIEGYVSAIEEMPDKNDRIGVLQSTGIIFWDYEDTWDRVMDSTDVPYDSSDDNIIDVEFSEV